MSAHNHSTQRGEFGGLPNVRLLWSLFCHIWTSLNRLISPNLNGPGVDIVRKV